MLDNPDQREFDHFQNGQKCDNNFIFIRTVRKQLNKGYRFFSLQDVNNLANFIFDLDFIGRHINPMIIGYALKNFLEGIDQL